MIRVKPQPEPAEFATLVREPGDRFLAECPQPIEKQWRSRCYWTRILKHLHTAYNGICAFTCHWIPLDTGNPTVEHFRPKSKYPELAYDWNNYRLVCGTLNGRKGHYEDVLDPFSLKDGWFVLAFPSCLIKPTPNLDPTDCEKVKTTIARLKLNDESCVRSRAKWVEDYANATISFDYLQRHAPFIAQELERQNLRDKIKVMMG